MQYAVTIENTGEIFHCAGGVHVLEAMEKSACKGIPVGCRNGGCGACKVRVTSGQYLVRKMNRAVLSAEEEASSCVLACKLYPQTEIKLTALGRVWGANNIRKSGSFSFDFSTTSHFSQSDKET